MRPPRAIDERVQPATEQDWYTEYLDAIIAVRVVEEWTRPSRTSASMARSTPTAS